MCTEGEGHSRYENYGVGKKGYNQVYYSGRQRGYRGESEELRQDGGEPRKIPSRA